MKDKAKLLKLLSGAGKILLVTHKSPDGDGIGSQLALYHGLAKLGQSVHMYNLDGVPRIYRFMPDSGKVHAGDELKRFADVDVVIALDCGSRARLGLPDTFFKEKILVNIDHHASNERFGNLNLVDPKACSTGVLVFELLKQMQVSITPAIAEAVYVTLLTDTASFHQRNTTGEVLRLAAELVEAGAKPHKIATHVYESNRLARMRLLTASLDTLELRDDGQSAWLHVLPGHYLGAAADAEDTEGFIDYARSIEGVRVAVFIRPETDKHWKVSFRGKGVDVSQIAVQLGGGGHVYAAGCNVSGTFSEVLARVEAEVTKSLK